MAMYIYLVSSLKWDNVQSGGFYHNISTISIYIFQTQSFHLLSCSCKWDQWSSPDVSSAPMGTQHAEKHTVYAIKACSDWHVFIFSRRTENSWYIHLQITGRAVRCLQIHFCVIVFLCWVSDPLSSSDSAVSAYSQLSVMSRWQKNSTDIDYTAVYSRMLQFSACLWHVKYMYHFPIVVWHQSRNTSFAYPLLYYVLFWSVIVLFWVLFLHSKSGLIFY